MAARLAVVRLATAGLPDSGWLHEAAAHHNIQIRTFGRFEVRVDGLTVSTAAWQSRQARDLLRTLVCRRGRAITRDQLCELLWPDEDPDRTRHRLSVLLSIVRGVIGSQVLSSQTKTVWHSTQTACTSMSSSSWTTLGTRLPSTTKEHWTTLEHFSKQP